MKKFLVLPNGEQLQLVPLTCHEFCIHAGLDPHELASWEAYEDFKEANNYFELDDVDDGLDGAVVEVREGNPYLVWSLENKEWQADYREHNKLLGYPNDDQNALQQLADGNWNLDIYYAFNFVQNENVESNVGGFGEELKLMLEHTPVVPSSATGTVYYSGTAVQTFASLANGSFNFVPIGHPEQYITEMSVKNNTGEILVKWNQAVAWSHVKLVISYEYDAEAKPPEPKYKQYKKKILKNDVNIE